ncbi:hypothetical protein ABPG73_012644 [Tetrahymena malaccensis]
MFYRCKIVIQHQTTQIEEHIAELVGMKANLNTKIAGLMKIQLMNLVQDLFNIYLQDKGITIAKSISVVFILQYYLKMEDYILQVVAQMIDQAILKIKICVGQILILIQQNKLSLKVEQITQLIFQLIKQVITQLCFLISDHV